MANSVRRLAAGYCIRNRYCIYGGGHWSQGDEVWKLWQQYRERFPKTDTYLEFGSRLSYEDIVKGSGSIVGVESAFCTGLII